MKKKLFSRSDLRWALRVTLLSFAIAVLLTLVSDAALDRAGMVSALVVLLLFVFVNIAFDMLGMAAATADEKPFHSMATRRVRGSAESIRIIRNAAKVSSFCSDVVGDICGIVSGTCSAAVVFILTGAFGFDLTVTALAVTGALAGLTIGGKALGKPLAMRYNRQIVHSAGLLMSVFKRKKAKKK